MRFYLSALVLSYGAAATGAAIDESPLSIGAAIAERQAACSGPAEGNPSVWWRAQIGHNGTTPYATDNTYEYYRVVSDYGADPTGFKDSSSAFNAAINAWNRTGNTVTTRPAYVYVPPGTYVFKKSIQMLVNTYLIGDALVPPTLVSDPELGNKTIIYGYDAYQGDGSATKNFYMSVRNFKLDTTQISSSIKARAMDWSVSQGCSLINVHITMPSNSNHTGITMSEGGSGTIIADCSFTGGRVGLELSNQQYMLKGLTFDGCSTGIYFDGSYVTTIQGNTFKNCNLGIDISRSGSAGSVSVVDTTSACAVGVEANVTAGNGEGSLVLDNFSVTGGVGVKSSAGDVLLSGSVPAGQTWVLGYETPQDYQKGTTYPIARPADLLSNGDYFTMPLPQYEKYDVSQFASVKLDPDYPVFGDNAHDDGPSINAILSKNAGCKIVFFPQGIYRTNETIYVPPGSRIVGEVFSVISGVGSQFANADAPSPIVQVGHPGEKGVAQFTDMLFTTADVLPGAVIVEVNMAGNSPGDVGFWDCVIRVGGSVDSLVSHKCSDPDPSDCMAAFALLHVTKTASVYFEDIWGWVADHNLDPDLPAQNIAVGRGALVESKGPTWLVGSAFEHATIYQYALSSAQNIYMGMHQTESPYWQGAGTPHRAPAPWTANAAYGDPTFSNCATQGQGDNDQCFRAWGLHMNDSSDVIIHGSGLWVFFNKMNDNEWKDAQCNDTNNICQLNMAFVSGAQSTYWYSLSAKSTTNLVYDTTNGTGVVATQQKYPGSWGSVIAAYLSQSSDPSSDSTSSSSSSSSKNGARAVEPGSLLRTGLPLLLCALSFVYW